jgi:outer membrane receptor protein involved in Fe transport
MKKSLLTASVVLLFVISMGIFGFAQSDNGTITGTVTDAQGAVIPNATVTATNTGTNHTYTAKTDGRGAYTIPSAVIGNYHVEAKADNFKTSAENFQLNINEQKDFSPALQLGSVSETVTVDAGATVVDTTSSASGEVIQGEQVTELPLNGRNFTQLALLTPGVTRGAYGSQASGIGNETETFRYAQTGGAALSVNGLRQQSNNYELDGVDNNEALVNSIVFFPPVEATQEFKVTTSIAPAEFGRAGGGIIQSSIKSGTNQWHGSAFDFLRNSYFDANNAYFHPITNGKETPKSPFKRNQFGGTFGGAIIKDKLFFFVDYQGFRSTQPQNPQFTTVPTTLMRQGNFSELLGTNLTHPPSCAPVGAPLGSIFNPLNCQPFAGNIMNGYISPVGTAYLNAFPQPNVPGTIQNNFTSRPVVSENYNDYDVKIDYTIGAKDTIFGRYSYAEDDTTQQTVLGTLPSGFGSGGRNASPRGAVIGETHTFGSTLLNDLRIGWVRQFYQYLNPFESTPVSANLGIPGANRSPVLGGGALIGPYDNSISYSGDGGPYIVKQPTWQAEDNVSWIRGNHSFKFGANLIHRDVNFFESDYRGKGFFQIGNGDTTGYAVSELLDGFMTEYDISTPVTNATRAWETGYYAQDDWKVSSRLTLNLGLRYDLYTNPTENKNQLSNFDLNTGQLLVAGANGNSASLINTDKNNFGPRVGFAYDLFGQGKTILRGGFGIFYFLDRGGIGNELGENANWTAAGAYQYSNGYRVTLSGIAPLNSTDPSTAVAGAIYGPAPVSLTNPTNTQVLAYPPNNQASSINEWNLQLSQELGNATEFDLAYAGNVSDHLMTVYNANGPHLADSAPNPYAAAGLNVIVNAASGTSNYNGLQARIVHRMTNGFQYTAAYTWSHALDNSRGAFSNLGSNQQIFTNYYGSQLQYNYGNSDDDQRQAFTFSTLYELPFGHGKRWGSSWNGVANQALGGWQFNMITSLGTGTPFDLTYGPGNCNNCQVHPNFSGSVKTGNQGKAANGSVIWLTGGNFTPVTQNPDGTFASVPTMAKNQFYGPGYNPVDISIFKDFTLTERLKMQFRAEAYNLFNTPQFTNPQGLGYTTILGVPTITNNNGNFGEINATRNYSERELQFALRFSF